jgi:hypothetical protein
LQAILQRMQKQPRPQTIDLEKVCSIPFASAKRC